MTDSPHPGLSTPAEAITPEQTITTIHSTNRKTNDHNAFSELNSIRPLGMGIQDLRPLRVGLRPILDPHASLAFTHTASEKPETSTRTNHHY